MATARWANTPYAGLVALWALGAAVVVEGESEKETLIASGSSRSDISSGVVDNQSTSSTHPSLIDALVTGRHSNTTLKPYISANVGVRGDPMRVEWVGTAIILLVALSLLYTYYLHGENVRPCNVTPTIATVGVRPYIYVTSPSFPPSGSSSTAKDRMSPDQRSEK